MDDLDEADLFLSKPLGVDEPPPKRKIPLRPLLTALVVAVLGGGLGAGGYYLSNMDMRDVIGAMDVADQPKLSISMPGAAKPGAAGKETAPMLAPPGSEPAAEGKPEAAPTEHPQGPAIPPAEEAPRSAPEIAAVPAMPPASPSSAAPEAAAPVAEPAKPAPIIIKQVEQSGPIQPLPRPADKPPNLAELPDPKIKGLPLPAAPAEGMFKNSGRGPLPIVAADGRKAWQVYARPFPEDDKKPRLAVVVADLGLDKNATEAAIDKMPPEVTLAFSPYAGNLDVWVKKARDAGHEVLLMLPMEQSGFPAKDPGPWGLTASATVQDNVDRLLRVLARTSGYVGILASDGPFARSDQAAAIAGKLKDRGLLYVGPDNSAAAAMPWLDVGAVLDREGFHDYIVAQTKQAAAIARDKGRLAVQISPKPVSLDVVARWMTALAAEGVAPAPVSAVVRIPGGKS